jgi:hypothetical protein
VPERNEWKRSKFYFRKIVLVREELLLADSERAALDISELKDQSDGSRIEAFRACSSSLGAASAVQTTLQK